RWVHSRAGAPPSPHHPRLELTAQLAPPPLDVSWHLRQQMINDGSPRPGCRGVLGHCPGEGRRGRLALPFEFPMIGTCARPTASAEARLTTREDDALS